MALPDLGQLQTELATARPQLLARSSGAAGTLHSLRAAAAALGETGLAGNLTLLEDHLDSADDTTWRQAVELFLGVSADPTPAIPTPPAPAAVPAPAPLPPTEPLPQPLVETPAPRPSTPAASGRVASPSPSPVPDTAASAAHGRLAAEQLVHISVGKLDALLALAGEISVVRLRLETQLKELAHEQELTRDTAQKLASRVRWRPVQDTQLLLAQLSEQLSQEVLGARLQPAGPFFQGFERVLRDALRQTGKQGVLIVEGGETELDRHLIEQLRDPLIHVIRNAVDHGIEAAEVRESRGKPAQGQITLKARSVGGMVEIVIQDDGNGVDLAAVRRAAAQRGLPEDQLSDEQLESEGRILRDLLLSPGFSSREEVTALSGRGVGLDVVRERIRELGGDVTLDSEAGHGTRLTLSLPLTLATRRVIVLLCGEQLLALPVSWTDRVGRIRPSDLVSSEGQTALKVHGQVVPSAELTQLLKLPHHTVSAYLILRLGREQRAILVSDLIGEQEVVVKPLGWPLVRIPHLEGAAVLGSGEVVPILNPAEILSRAALSSSSAILPTLPSRPVQRRILVTDDTLTTRLLLMGLLEDAGFEVVGAPDGREAWHLLQREAFDALLSDVEMPHMTGLELTRQVRDDSRTAHLPVVLLTSLGASEQRAQGAEAGADAYLVKGEFDHEVLIETLERLL